MGFLIGAIAPALIGIGATWNREGSNATILACVITLIMGFGVNVWPLNHGPVDPMIGFDPLPWVFIPAAVIMTALWRRRTFFKRRAQNDLRN